jgi:hypothetical protein
VGVGGGIAATGIIAVLQLGLKALIPIAIGVGLVLIVLRKKRSKS